MSTSLDLGFAIGTALANALPSLLLGAVVVLAVFLVVRWFWLWYWRVNEQVALLKRQVELLQAIAASTQLLEERGRALPSRSPAAAATRT